MWPSPSIDLVSVTSPSVMNWAAFPRPEDGFEAPIGRQRIGVGWAALFFSMAGCFMVEAEDSMSAGLF